MSTTNAKRIREPRYPNEIDVVKPPSPSLWDVREIRRLERKKQDANSTLIGTVKTVTEDYTLVETDHTLLVDTTAGHITITLPSGLNAGLTFNIKKISTNNLVTIVPINSDLIDGHPTLIIRHINSATTLIADGNLWEKF